MRAILNNILICFLLIHVNAFAQSESTIEKTDLLKGKSAYISNDKVEINIHGKGEKDQSYMSFEINRDVTFHILNGHGLKIFENFKLPQDFDPTFIAHGPSVKNLGIYYSDYKIEDFKVVVHRKRKKPFTPKYKKRILQKESFNLDYLYNYSQHSYQFTDLMIGDEVHIKYTIIIPFKENYSRFASYRIFFQDSLPKLKYELTLTNHEVLDIELFEFNNAKLRSDYTSDRIRKRIWKYENLQGNIAEPGSRAYLQLPYITWVINFYKYYAHNQLDLKNLPHYAVISSVREKDLNDILTSIEIGSKSKQFAPFETTYEKLSFGKPRDYSIISEIHRVINDDFAYDSDQEFYRRNDLRGERLGEFFSNSVLRDASRYNMYYAIMIRSGLRSYSAYLIDKRFGEISDSYFLPNFDNDYLLAVFFGEKLTDYILPKKHRYGWYYNELPFYYENTKSRLVHLTDYVNDNSSVKEGFRSRMTGFSEPSKNSRKSNYRVAVDLAMDSLYFNGEISLSGQYSTLCRGVYMNGYKDPSVDKRYNRALWQIIPFSESLEINAGGVSSEFPFIAQFENSFKSGLKVKKEDDTYSIDLKNFFPHVVPPPLENQDRTLNYYPDFQGVDKLNYEFQFTKPVELLSESFVVIENEYVSYKFKLVQVNSTSIGVASEYTCKSEMVSAEEYEEVQKAFKAIKESNNFVLKVK